MAGSVALAGGGASVPHMAPPAPVLDAPLASLADLEAAGEPRVLRGLVSAWPALTRWTTAASLTAPVPASATVDVLVNDCAGSAGRREAESSSFEGFVAGPWAAREPGARLAQEPLTGALAGLAADASMPGLLEPVAGRATAHLWLTGGVSTASLHYDSLHGLLCVATGSKTVTLAPPSATALLDPAPPGGESANHAGAAALALAAAPGALHTVLAPGDVLFIPNGWWHAVASSERTAAVSFWWASDLVRAIDGRPEAAAFALRHAVTRMVEEAMRSEAANRVAAAGAVAPDAALSRVRARLEHGGAASSPAADWDACIALASLPPDAALAALAAGVSECSGAGLAALAASPAGAHLLPPVLEGGSGEAVARLHAALDAEREGGAEAVSRALLAAQAAAAAAAAAAAVRAALGASVVGDADGRGEGRRREGEGEGTRAKKRPAA